MSNKEYLPILVVMIICNLQVPLFADATLLKTAAEGQCANYESFDTFSCYYRIWWHKAKSVEDAQRGRFLPGSIYSDATWLQHREKILVNIKCEPAALRKVASLKNGDSVPCTEHIYLSDGNYSLLSGYIIASASLRRLPQTAPACYYNMFQLDQPNIYCHFMDKTKHKDLKARLIEEKDHVLEVEVRYSDDELIERTWLDAKQGYLPIETHSFTNNKRLEMMQVTDVLKCSGNRFIPKRALIIRNPDNADATEFDVREYIIDQFSERAPADKDFRVDLPEGYQYSVAVEKDAFHVPKGGVHCHLSELPEQYEALLEVGRQRKPVREAAERHLAAQTSTIGSSYWWFISLGILALGGWLAVRYVRKRKQMAA